MADPTPLQRDEELLHKSDDESAQFWRVLSQKKKLPEALTFLFAELVRGAKVSRKRLQDLLEREISPEILQEIGLERGQIALVLELEEGVRFLSPIGGADYKIPLGAENAKQAQVELEALLEDLQTLPEERTISEKASKDIRVGIGAFMKEATQELAQKILWELELRKLEPRARESFIDPDNPLKTAYALERYGEGLKRKESLSQKEIEAAKNYAEAVQKQFSEVDNKAHRAAEAIKQFFEPPSAPPANETAPLASGGGTPPKHPLVIPAWEMGEGRPSAQEPSAPKNLANSTPPVEEGETHFSPPDKFLPPPPAPETARKTTESITLTFKGEGFEFSRTNALEALGELNRLIAFILPEQKEGKIKNLKNLALSVGEVLRGAHRKNEGIQNALAHLETLAKLGFSKFYLEAEEWALPLGDEPGTLQELDNLERRLERGISSPETRENLSAWLEEIKTHYPSGEVFSKIDKLQQLLAKLTEAKPEISSTPSEMKALVPVPPTVHSLDLLPFGLEKINKRLAAERKRILAFIRAGIIETLVRGNQTPLSSVPPEISSPPPSPSRLALAPAKVEEAMDPLNLPPLWVRGGRGAPDSEIQRIKRLLPSTNKTSEVGEQAQIPVPQAPEKTEVVPTAVASVEPALLTPDPAAPLKEMPYEDTLELEVSKELPALLSLEEQAHLASEAHKKIQQESESPLKEGPPALEAEILPETEEPESLPSGERPEESPQVLPQEASSASEVGASQGISGGGMEVARESQPEKSLPQKLESLKFNLMALKKAFQKPDSSSTLKQRQAYTQAISALKTYVEKGWSGLKEEEKKTWSFLEGAERQPLVELLEALNELDPETKEVSETEITAEPVTTENAAPELEPEEGPVTEFLPKASFQVPPTGTEPPFENPAPALALTEGLNPGEVMALPGGGFVAGPSPLALEPPVADSAYKVIQASPLLKALRDAREKPVIEAEVMEAETTNPEVSPREEVVAQQRVAAKEVITGEESAPERQVEPAANEAPPEKTEALFHVPTAQEAGKLIGEFMELVTDAELLANLNAIQSILQRGSAQKLIQARLNKFTAELTDDILTQMGQNPKTIEGGFMRKWEIIDTRIEVYGIGPKQLRKMATEIQEDLESLSHDKSVMAKIKEEKEWMEREKQGLNLEKEKELHLNLLREKMKKMGKVEQNEIETLIQRMDQGLSYHLQNDFDQDEEIQDVFEGCLEDLAAIYQIPNITGKRMKEELQKVINGFDLAV